MKPEESSKQQLLDWAQEIRAVCEQENDSAALRTIDEAVERFRADRFVISVMGLAKRGKSTLINALLGRSDDMLAPIDELPATSVCTTFSHSQKEKIQVIFRDGKTKEINADEIRSYATEDLNPENCKDVQLIRIETPSAEKFSGVVFVDLPGSGSIHEHHDQVVRQFLPQSDAVLLMTTARMPISAAEIELLESVRKTDVEKIFFVMNKIDKVDPQELEEGKSANLRKLAEAKVPAGVIYEISAKRAFEGDWETSGVSKLMDAVSAFIDKHRGEIVKKRFVAEVKAAAAQTLREADLRARFSELSPDELEKLRGDVTRCREELELANKLRAEKFRSRWNRIVDEFEQRLPSVKTSVEVSLNEKMSEASIVNIGKFKKNLPGFFADTLENALAPVAQEMEEKLRMLTEEYDRESPAVCIAADGTVSAVQNVSRTAEGVLAGTGATLAVGGGLFATVASGLTTTALTPFGAFGAYLASNLAGATTTIGTATVEGSLVGIAGGSMVTPAITTGVGDALIGAGGAAAAVNGTYTVPTFLATVANPIGWTIAGVGLVAVATAWGLKRGKDLKKMKECVSKKTQEVFEHLREKKVPELKKMGESVIAEFETTWKLQSAALGKTMSEAALSGKSAELKKQAQSCRNKMSGLLEI